MCDYCGCRAHPPIQELAAEHEAALDLAYQLDRHAAVGDHAGAATAAAELATVLAPHTAKEEAGLFAVLRDCWEADGRLVDLIDQHRSIDADLEIVVSGGSDWQQAARQVARDLADHISDEEVDLFPYAMYELSDRQWQQVEAVHAIQQPVEAPSRPMLDGTSTATVSRSRRGSAATPQDTSKVPFIPPG